jgi:hypothetical protein
MCFGCTPTTVPMDPPKPIAALYELRSVPIEISETSASLARAKSASLSTSE